MWQVTAYFRWAEVENEPIYIQTFSSKKKARAAGRIWMESGVEFLNEKGIISFVPAASIHYIQVQEII